MKIIQLTASNVKRLKAVEITPDGTLQIVGGGRGHHRGRGSAVIAHILALVARSLGPPRMPRDLMQARVQHEVTR